MKPLTTASLIRKRLADDGRLLGSTFFGITIATALVAGAPVYIKSLEKLGVSTAINRSSDVSLNIFAFGPHIPLDQASLEAADQKVDEGIQQHLSEINRGSRRYLKTPNYLVGIPLRPLEEGQRVGRGYFQHIGGLEENVTFKEGRMATDLIEAGPGGPVVEAVVSSALATQLHLVHGDSVVFIPSFGTPTRVTARIVGIVDPIDPSSEYWQGNASIFMEPPPLTEDPDVGVEIDPEEPPAALFVTLSTMTRGVGETYPGTLVTSTWYIFVDKEPLKDWSIEETRARIRSFRTELSAAHPGATTLTGIERLLDDFETRSFFSSVPLLLLLTIMVITVLYYVSMMVSYLVQSREGEVALLRGRGISTLHLLRLYSLEGLVLTVVAVALAPFLSMAAIALAGKLPYFREITGGKMLPVELHWLPFLVAAATGLLTLAIFVVPRVVGARTGLVIHKLRSSRPPSVPLFHRYYLDVVLIVVGGLIFWELQAKGQLVSGGLFEDVEVNEALLLAPVLFLTVVALLFLRFFPLFVRFISGESRALLNLVAAATLVSLAAIEVVRDVEEDGGLGWLGPVLLLASVGAAYWLTGRAGRAGPRLVRLAVQSGLIALFLMVEPPSVGENSFVPTVSLISLVPAQVVFLLLRVSSQIAPVWVSVGLWHMARNPLQYSWLVLLLVMVTGLGLLATTVGGTLDRSHEQRILYDVAAEVRMSGLPPFGNVTRQIMKERYLAMSGVTSASLAFRTFGRLGTTGSGRAFDVLAVEPQEFPYISWWRDDFASQSLNGLMRALHPGVRAETEVIPEGATSVGIWIKPEDFYPNISLWLVLEDSRDVVFTVSLGGLGEPDWHLIRKEIPAGLEPPLQVVSVQLWEPGFGPVGTPGTVLFDELHATVGPDGEYYVLDDFEDRMKWLPMPTSVVSTDFLTLTGEEPFRDQLSASFTFGKETNRGIRGFSHISAGGLVPIVASTGFSRMTGYDVGDIAVLEIMEHLVPVVVRGKVELFPTMLPGGLGFVVADLDSLLRHLNIVNSIQTVIPNEVLIDEAPGASGTVRDSLLSRAVGRARVHDRETALESVRLNPLVTAGWRAMVVLSTGIILFTAAFGYLTYMLSFADRSRGEMGFLRSLGLSRRQLAGLLVLEHGVILVVGLALGSWAGLEMSRRMVSAVAVTDTGEAVLPPFSLITDWAFMIPIYVALIAIFGIALYALTRSMRSLDLQTISRFEG